MSPASPEPSAEPPFGEERAWAEGPRMCPCVPIGWRRSRRLLVLRSLSVALSAPPGDFTQQKCISSQFRGPEVRKQSIDRASLPAKALGKDPSCLIGLLAAPGVLGLWPQPDHKDSVTEDQPGALSRVPSGIRGGKVEWGPPGGEEPGMEVGGKGQ